MSEEKTKEDEGKGAEKVPQEILKDKSEEAARPDKDAEPDMIDKANMAAERLEKANAELKKTLDRQEKIEADRIASGRGFAGQSQTEKKVETDKEYWDKVKKGELPNAPD